MTHNYYKETNGVPWLCMETGSIGEPRDDLIISGRRGSGRQTGMLLDGLRRWHGGISLMELSKNFRDRSLRTDIERLRSLVWYVMMMNNQSRRLCKGSVSDVEAVIFICKKPINIENVSSFSFHFCVVVILLLLF